MPALQRQAELALLVVAAEALLPITPPFKFLTVRMQLIKTLEPLSVGVLIWREKAT